MQEASPSSLQSNICAERRDENHERNYDVPHSSRAEHAEEADRVRGKLRTAPGAFDQRSRRDPRLGRRRFPIRKVSKEPWVEAIGARVKLSTAFRTDGEWHGTTHVRLTVKLRGRTQAPDWSRGRTLSSSARGDTTDSHGPLQRLLEVTLTGDHCARVAPMPQPKATQSRAKRATALGTKPIRASRTAPRRGRGNSSLRWRAPRR
jgi:hypothetical protein